MKKKTKRKKLALGTGKNGLVRNYIESPNETLTENEIAMAKARQKAENNPWAKGLGIFGNMAMQYGMSMAGGSGGVGKGIKEGFGNIFGGGQAANGGTVTGPGKKKKKGTRDVTEEESITEAEGSQFTPEGIMALFGVDEFETIETNPLNLGKYKDVGYFDSVQDPSGRYTLKNTSKNPANYALYKQQLKNIMKLNPGIDITMDGFTPLINQKAFGGKAGVNVEVEGKEVGETPDGQLIDFKGPSHENGGIDIELPEGTEIFSKRIKVGGKTMAERKKAREKKTLSLEKLLEKSGNDKVLQDTLERTRKNNEREEASDQEIQEMVSMVKGNIAKLSQGKQYRAAKSDDPNAAMKIMQDEIIPSGKPVVAAYGTGKKGVKGYADGTGEEGVLPGEEGFQLPNFTGGDLVGLAGTLYSAFQPMKNTLDNRAGDTPNINAFEDFGNDALDSIDSAKTYVAGQRDKALQDIETNRTRTAQSNRRSARGINTSRALDLATQVNANKAEGDIYDNFSKQMMQMLSQQAGFENQQDQAVMTGEQNKDLADRQDRDNYYTQMAQDIATKGEGIQTLGKMLNENKKNTMSEKAVNALSKYGFKWENGNIVDSKGNPITTEQKQALKTLGIITE